MAATDKKARTVITTMDEENACILFKVAGVGTVQLDMEKLHPDVLSKAAFIGMYNRLVDATALRKGATAQEKFDELQRLATHYETGTGEWALTRASGGGGHGRKEVVEAMVYVFGIDASTADMRIRALAQKRGVEEKEAVKLFGQSDKVLARINEVRAARVTVDADDLMADAMGDAGADAGADAK
jgi:hypothetical protein